MKELKAKCQFLNGVKIIKLAKIRDFYIRVQCGSPPPYINNNIDTMETLKFRGFAISPEKAGGINALLLQIILYLECYLA